MVKMWGDSSFLRVEIRGKVGIGISIIPVNNQELLTDGSTKYNGMLGTLYDKKIQTCHTVIMRTIPMLNQNLLGYKRNGFFRRFFCCYFEAFLLVEI